MTSESISVRQVRFCWAVDGAAFNSRFREELLSGLTGTKQLTGDTILSAQDICRASVALRASVGGCE